MKKFAAAILFVTMMLSLTACSTQKPENTTPSVSIQTEPSNETDSEEKNDSSEATSS